MRDRIVKGGRALGLRQLISLPLNGAGVVIVSILLTPADFGVFAILTILTSLALAVVDLGTTNALVQSHVPPSARLLHQVQCYKFSAGLICILLYVLLSPWISTYYHLPEDMIFLFPVAGLVAWLQSQRGYQSVWLQRRVEWQVLAHVEMAEILIYNVVLVISAYLLRSPWSFVLSMSLRAASGVILLNLTARRFKQATESSGGNFRSLIGFGVPFQTTTILSMIQKSINPIIVGSLAGVSAVGLVNWSNYIVSLPMLPLQPLQGFLFSIVSQRKREGHNDNEVIQTVVRLGSVLITLVSLVIILLLPLLVTQVFGNKWNEAVPIVSILLFGNTVIIPSLIIPTHLTAKGHSMVWMQIVIVETILIWVMGGLGILIYGLPGYATGLLGASILILAIECALTKKLTGLKVRFLDSIRLMIIALLSILAGRSIGFLLSYGEGLKEVLQVVVGVAVFLVLLALTDFKRLRLDLGFLAIMMNFRFRSPQHGSSDQG